MMAADQLSLAPEIDLELVDVRRMIPDAPVSENHRVPVGWRLNDEMQSEAALVRVISRRSEEVVTNVPVVISAWVANETTRLKGLEVAWKSQHRWRHLVADRETVRDGNKLLRLAARGFPVHSGNRSNLVRYLAAYEEENLGRMPVRRVSEQMGWHDGAFVLGRGCVGGDLSFAPPDAGEEQLADAVASAGEAAAWAEGVAAVARYPAVELALYASLATVLLEPTGVANFAVDWSYQTSTGKTTALRVAASVWGSPDERSSRSMISSWDSTPVWLERAAAARSGLPLIVDDTKRAQRVRGESTVPRVIYELAQGQGRGRGSIAGARATRSWRTILLSTGEQRITDFSKDGGTVSRVLSLWGPPFGMPTPETAAVIADLNRALAANYGHAGPRFVAWVSEHIGEAESWKDQLARLAADYAVRLEGLGVGVAHRIADYLALLDLTSRLAHIALELPWRLRNPVAAVLSGVATGAQDTDRAAEALRHVYAWAVGRRAQFFYPNAGDPPPQGWLGRWDRDTGDDKKPDLVPERWPWLGVTRPALDAELERVGFDPAAIVSTWGDRGWLEISNGRRTVPTRVAGELVRVVAIRREVIDDVDRETS